MRERAVYTPLRRKRDFGRVHTQGRRKGDARLQVRVATRPAAVQDPAPVRLGIIVGKKYGSAVARNRFKRLVRAALRTLGPALTPGWDILVLPRNDAHTANMPEILGSLQLLLGILGVIRMEPSPSVAEEHPL